MIAQWRNYKIIPFEQLFLSYCNDPKNTYMAYIFSKKIGMLKD